MPDLKLVCLAVFALALCNPSSGAENATSRFRPGGSRPGRPETRSKPFLLSRLSINCVSAEWGVPKRNLSIDGNPLRIAGTTYTQGIGTHAYSKIVVNLSGGSKRFRALVGLDDEMEGSEGTVEFVVTGDGRELFRSGAMRPGDPAKLVDVELGGVSALVLEATDAGDGIGSDHADWADGIITVSGRDPVVVCWEANEAFESFRQLRRFMFGGTTLEKDEAFRKIKLIEGMYRKIGAEDTRIRPLLESIRLTGDLPKDMQETYETKVGQGSGTREIWLDEFGTSAFTSGWGIPHAGKSVDGNPLKIDGREFTRGIGTHAVSRFTLDLFGEADSFSAVVGIDDEQASEIATVVFNILGDGKVIWTSGVVRASDPPRDAKVELKGVKELTLEVSDAGDGIGGDHADWADAKLLVTGRAPVVVRPLRNKDARYTSVSWRQPFDRLSLTWENHLAMSAPPEGMSAARAAAFFPGEVPANLKRIRATVTVDLARPFWHSTGLYAAPGELITAEIPQDMTGRGLSIQIGCHTDDLWHLEDLYRAPEITKSFPLKSVRTAAANPFGGLVYVVVPGYEDGKLTNVPGMFHWTVSPVASGSTPVKVTITGAVRAPRYVHGETDTAEWVRSIRKIPVPFGEIEGKAIVFQMPKAMLAGIDDPGRIAAFWDEVMAHQADLAGWSGQKFPMYFTLDRQISAGGGHSGYPIMAYIDWGGEIVDVDRVRKEGGWGAYHEIGHNHQEWSGWTFQDQVEVTVNLFSLYCNMKMSGWKIGLTDEKPSEDWNRVKSREWHMETLKRYFSRDPKVPGRWKEAGLDHRLGFYVELIDAFGWEPVIKVIRSYRDNPRFPESQEGQGGEYMVRLSRIVGRNLCPFFRGWGIEMPAGIEDEVKDLPAWMPDYISAL